MPRRPWSPAEWGVELLYDELLEAGVGEELLEVVGGLPLIDHHDAAVADPELVMDRAHGPGPCPGLEGLTELGHCLHFMTINVLNPLGPGARRHASLRRDSGTT